MKIKVKFTIYKRTAVDAKDPIGFSELVAHDFDGTLVGFGLDCGDKGSWSTGIVVTPDGHFNNIPVERITLLEPFKDEDWPA